MRSRSLAAFLVGVVIFTIVPYFDAVIPGGEYLLVVGLGLCGGVVVVLIAGDWRAWWLAPACALLGELIGQTHYEVALKPPPRDGFEVASVAFGAFYTFVFSGLFSVVGALLAGTALALAGYARRLRSARR